jgi:hypothetical protein
MEPIRERPSPGISSEPIARDRNGGITLARAEEAARRWVIDEASQMPGFAGAFLAGSTNWLPENAPLPASSDVDVKVVLDTPTVPGEPQKLRYRGVVLDVSYAPCEDVRSAEAVLGNYYTAGHFARQGIIADPHGHLHAIQPRVAREFTRRKWVRARAEHAREFPPAILGGVTPGAPPHDRVYTWLLAVCLLTHPVLVADLRNPTIRKCLVTFEDVVARYDHRPLHGRVLGILGSDRMQRGEVEALLASCTEAFDTAQAVITTPFFGASNISEYGRPMAIDGTREMIAEGYHREAVFWIAAIHTWCQKALWNDAPESIRSSFRPGYEHLLGVRGIRGVDDLDERVEQTCRLLPDVWSVTEEIIVRNPAIAE